MIQENVRERDSILLIQSIFYFVFHLIYLKGGLSYFYTSKVDILSKKYIKFKNWIFISSDLLFVRLKKRTQLFVQTFPSILHLKVIRCSKTFLKSIQLYFPFISSKHWIMPTITCSEFETWKKKKWGTAIIVYNLLKLK